MSPRVVILGAGIGGLAAAHHLTLRAAERGIPLEVVVLEASDRPGGWLATERCEGALLERGPDTLVTHKPAGLALCERLGLSGRILFIQAGRIDIFDHGRLIPLPAGFALAVGADRSVGSAGSGEPADESVASYVRRQFGDELYRRFYEPVMGGLFMADTEELSLAASFPRRASQGSEPGRPSSPLRPAAATLDGGLGQIVSALVARLPEGSLRLDQRVERLAREGRGFLIKMSEGPPLAADAVLIALPATAAAALLSDLDPPLAGELGQISYASAVTVHLAWPNQAVEEPPRCHGFFVPRTAGSPVVAVTFVSVKHPERTPADQFVVRVYLGGALHPEAIGRTDAELVEISARLLASLLGLREPPLWSRVWRHPSAMPQRKVGHPALVARLRARLAAHPGLDFAGGPLGAYGLPDSIAEGEAAAERLLGHAFPS
ncbi:MAG TPA: protoporphyrinogen oxidase [Thermoanaerobaculia bacterium]|nr:protoporphyrinogen oxidase [Thermoanaerobaculia bacterium]